MSASGKAIDTVLTLETRRPTMDDLRARAQQQANEDGERLLHLVNDPECLRGLYDLSGEIARSPHPLPYLRATIDCWREQLAQEKEDAAS